MGNRVFNFSAGPSTLPEEVLKKAAAEMLDYDGTGESVMEMSHRSAEFQKIIDDAEQNLRDLMNIPDDYYVLFLQGGGTLQFSMVPINLLTNSKKADYIITGNWEDIREDVDYVYICYNNTIYGTHYNEIPDVGDHLLVADMSSCILSEEIDVTKFGLIYAGAQKNVAPAGVTIVIVRKDLVGHAPENTPIYLDYAIHAKKGSMYNTPPCYPIYVAGEVFKYLKSIGGVKEMHERDVRKAGKLYDYLDSSAMFTPTVAKEDRSLMNVCFVTGNPDLDKKFIAGARERGMINLAGHRTTGGMRASIYNAMPEAGVDALIDYMKEFENENK